MLSLSREKMVRGAGEGAKREALVPPGKLTTNKDGALDE
jgi:hypothetical protein